MKLYYSELRTEARNLANQNNATLMDAMNEIAKKAGFKDISDLRDVYAHSASDIRLNNLSDVIQELKVTIISGTPSADRESM